MNIKKDVNAIRADIDTIKTNGAVLDDLIHETAVSCLAHAEAHGDVTLCSRLVQAMPRSSRSKALVHWFTQFGPLHFSKKEQGFVLAKGKNVKKYDVAGAMETPFYDFTSEREPLPFSIKRLIAMIERKIEKGKEKGEVTQQDVEMLQKAVATLHA